MVEQQFAYARQVLARVNSALETLTLALDSVSSVRGDTDAIQRVIQNLITNAAEAMDGEGTITLRVGRQDDMVACAVSDTGCGMTDEFVRTSVFVPFQTTKKGGWGIGLYQAREIMTAHAGRIERTANTRSCSSRSHCWPLPRARSHSVRARSRNARYCAW